MNKYGELQYQLEGLKNAIAKIESGINKDDVRYIRAEIRYFKEKTGKIIDEMEMIIDEE